MMLTNDMRQLSQPAGGSATGMFLIPAKQFLIDAPVCVCAVSCGNSSMSVCRRHY